MNPPPNPSNTCSTIYKNGVAKAGTLEGIVCYLRRLASAGTETPEPTSDLIWRLAMKKMAKGRAPTAIINRPQVEAQLDEANGSRKRRGVLTRKAVFEEGLPAVGLLPTGNAVFLAYPCWLKCEVAAVTCAVYMTVSPGEVLGYATVLPLRHPLLLGEVFQGLSDAELEAFFPEAYELKLRQIASAALQSTARSDSEFTTSLNLI